MICKMCGKEMQPGDDAQEMFICPTGHLYDSTKNLWLGCDCGYCQSRPVGSRIASLLQETGYMGKCKIPYVFLYGQPGYGLGI